ncbi:polysaccharide deacetylase [Clostridiaceae bacterium UIB06]|uniref:Polysaccharide deacetylase n=1 Tax=Clostridium thailandense TaxID=2794346 RepID=A0A949U113_9CLOT|nr:polysaccharide deacetylase family protein [Clostridium thailandense]MBV7274304.1 polysaccharide deacetylase [Clostridium thailandense]MCH5136204.1 polysaccharide deacetylase [Clostridiaceae bacterium UIB06]
MKALKYIKIMLITLFIVLFWFLLIAKDNNIKGASNKLTADSSDKKVIYLTFDDGPSDIITGKILDVLKENNVKATFFLIGNQINGLEDVVKRIHKEDHSIGLHTYTHKFKKVYSNKSSFINEMLQCRDKVNEVTGISPNIIRFPGGSRKRLNEEYLNAIHSCNFKIYDWNAETVDGLNPKASPNKLYRQATKNSGKISSIILLLHCDYMHKNTCSALPSIIKYYKDEGYEFKAITENTPEFYYPIGKKTFNFFDLISSYVESDC